MIEYDGSVVRAFAESLYTRAKIIVWAYTAAGAFPGLLVALGAAKGVMLFAGNDDTMMVVGVVGAVLLGLAGYANGRGKAFLLKLQAQTALCQVKIEENTRVRPA